MIPAERQTVRIARCAGCDAHKKKFIRPEVDMGRGLMSRTHAALGGLVMLCLPLTALLAQSATVSGVVTSEAGQPMVRANVFIDELNLSVATNPQGRYSI